MGNQKKASSRASDDRTHQRPKSLGSRPGIESAGLQNPGEAADGGSCVNLAEAYRSRVSLTSKSPSIEIDLSDNPQTPSEADRKAQIELADAENRIDGIARDAQTNVLFEAYVKGEIAVTDIVARLHSLLGV
jgi:hypothetical protein